MRHPEATCPEGTGLARLRLFQLVSPALPVGAYTYAQGLEWAVECGDVVDEASAARWIGDLLHASVGRFEAPLLLALLRAWADGDIARVAALDADHQASRETRELLAETRQMGFAARAVLPALGVTPAAREAVDALDAPSFITVWSFAAWHFGVSPREALAGWLWAWAENQVMAAIKVVPLGQNAGQRLLSGLIGDIDARVAAIGSDASPPARWCNLAPGLALASARHETQYSRLFRS